MTEIVGTLMFVGGHLALLVGGVLTLVWWKRGRA
jgi:hypothetical protein